MTPDPSTPDEILSTALDAIGLLSAARLRFEAVQRAIQLNRFDHPDHQALSRAEIHARTTTNHLRSRVLTVTTDLINHLRQFKEGTPS